MSEEEIKEKIKNITQYKEWYKTHCGEDIDYEDILALEEALDLIEKLQKENEELSESNFHFLEINQKLIEEKPIIKELTEKEFNLLKENEELKEDNKKLCAEISDLKELLGE